MSLPLMNATAGLAPAFGSFKGRAVGSAAGVDMALSFTCLLSCGASALGCITCGTNIPCWIGCAGPDIVNCVSKCF